MCVSTGAETPSIAQVICKSTTHLKDNLSSFYIDVEAGVDMFR